MKTIILAGGFGTRISEETANRPKPMIEIGGKPIIVHIMNFYGSYGFKDFVIAGGYKAEYIKDYFLNYNQKMRDYTLDMASGELTLHGEPHVDWKITIRDTGMNTMTGGRLKRLAGEVRAETFMMTYGDGLSDVDLSALVSFHNRHGKLATVTAVRPPSRFGTLVIDDDAVTEFEEKNPVKEGWINGGFFVLDPKVLDYIDDDSQPFEKEPLTRLSRDGQLMAFKHEGFWQPMDTLRDKTLLESVAASGKAPWHRAGDM